MSVQTIPSCLAKVGIHSLRLPLSAVEVLARNAGADTATWPPAVAFEAFEGSAKQAAGVVLRDAKPVDEGQLQQARAAELHRAEELRAEVERIRQVGGSRARRADQAAGRQRRQIAEAEHHQEQQVEQRKAERVRGASQTGQRQAQAARSVQQRRSSEP